MVFIPAPAAELSPEPEPLPNLTVTDLRLNATRIELTDHLHPEGYSTHIEGLSLTMADLSTAAHEGQPYRLEARSEGGGLLRSEGDVSISAGHSKGQLQLEKVDLLPAWRFAQPWLSFQLERSQLNLAIHYTVNWSDTLSFAVHDGSLTLQDSVLSPLPQTPLPDTGISLGRLSLEGINVASEQQSVSLDAVSLRGLSVAGWSEGDRVSLTELLLPQGTPIPQQQPPVAATSTTDPGWTVQLKLAKLEQGELRWRSEFTDPPLLEVMPITAELYDLRWPAVAPSAFSASLRVNALAQLDVAGALHAGSGNGDIAFAVETLPLAWFAPNLPDVLQAEISSGQARTKGTLQLNDFLPETVTADGAVSDFSMRLRGADDALTRWDSVSWIGLKGSVDGYAPVTLVGTASPLQAPPALDLTLRFNGLDMARLTPYSGNYAGYAIKNGVMTVDLRYGLENNRLQGNNKIVINQLQLGERVESRDAIDLPLRLGIALLTDSNGVIDIAVPVSGDLNNPQFSLGSVIAGAFVNLLTKAITAPFALLATLVGSSEELDTVDFAAGPRDSRSMARARRSLGAARHAARGRNASLPARRRHRYCSRGTGGREC